MVVNAMGEVPSASPVLPLDSVASRPEEASGGRRRSARYMNKPMPCFAETKTKPKPKPKPAAAPAPAAPPGGLSSRGKRRRDDDDASKQIVIDGSESTSVLPTDEVEKKRRVDGGADKEERSACGGTNKELKKKRGKINIQTMLQDSLDFLHKVSNELPPALNALGSDEMNAENGKDFADYAKLQGSTNKSMHCRVKEALRIFNKLYLQFVQEEEQRVKEAGKLKSEKDEENTKRTSKRPDLKAISKDGENTKRASKRPDLKAISKMLNDGLTLNREKRIGNLLGIDVGAEFFSRAEMVILGLHSHWLNGIDYIGVTANKGGMREFIIPGENKEYKLPLAVCIVLSGIYEDDSDGLDEIVYTGQGGIDLLGNKQQIKDQKMERGNLALKHSCESGLPVRVVRGHQSENSYTGKVYSYDGLYQVKDFWVEKGARGYTIFKYKLKRLEGQPSLKSRQVFWTRTKISEYISELHGLVCKDISGGQENIPIPVTNNVDDPRVTPTGFKYCNTMKISSSLKIPTNVVGCQCKGECSDPRVCECARLNDGFPYVRRDGGRLIEAKSIVFECGANCRCSKTCINRLSQQGLKYHLEVFKTENRGWGVRAWDNIPSGAPICEYVGFLTKSDEVENSDRNNYLFDIDCKQTTKGLDGREMRPGDVSWLLNSQRSDDVEYCIDAGSVGNVARFINHSCQPNCFIQCILSSHHNMNMAKVMVFAADNIPPLQELTYDYGYAMNSVVGADGKPTHMKCYCGSDDCRKWMY